MVVELVLACSLWMGLGWARASGQMQQKNHADPPFRWGHKGRQHPQSQLPHPPEHARRAAANINAIFQQLIQITKILGPTGVDSYT